jgi:hypothetical protein
MVSLTTTIRNVLYGPCGMPYAVRVETAGMVTLAHYWTEAEAWEARDAALDAGAIAVKVYGVPTRGYAVTPTATGLEIE